LTCIEAFTWYILIIIIFIIIIVTTTIVIIISMVRLKRPHFQLETWGMSPTTQLGSAKLC